MQHHQFINIRSSTHSHSFIHSFIHPSIHQSINQSINQSIHTSTLTSTLSFALSSTHSHAPIHTSTLTSAHPCSVVCRVCGAGRAGLRVLREWAQHDTNAALALARCEGTRVRTRERDRWGSWLFVLMSAFEIGLDIGFNFEFEFSLFSLLFSPPFFFLSPIFLSFLYALLTKKLAICCVKLFNGRTYWGYLVPISLCSYFSLPFSCSSAFETVAKRSD